ncbi:MAG: CDP-glycerol glycerophosphotransferase family protein [Butyribacter sp.]|nr:CDP-glycerol glycerophosphotransferase family protein [bacterium]MDY3855315.1 CDP-glycerol glycerophosphotransferase family protein [Butyribacter sp.]
MKNIEFTVEQVEIRGWKLWISVNIRGEYDNRVRNPKVAVIFNSGTQTRRVPVVIRSYTEKNGEFLIYAQYSYDVRYIFYHEPLGRQINFWFDVMYGDDYYEHISYRLGEIANQEYGLEDSEASEEADEDEEEEGTTRGGYYDIVFSTEKSEIDLIARFDTSAPSLFSRAVGKVRAFVGKLWGAVLFLMGFLLLPVFFVDALLAVLKCIPRKEEIAGSNWIIYLIKHARWKWTVFCKMQIGILPMKLSCMRLANKIASWFPVKKNRIAFLSNRRNDLSGNFEFVYDILKEDESLDIRFVLDNHDTKHMKFRNMIRLAIYFANSKIILVDDYMELLFKLPRREGTTLIQLWHACGAFKTFGCSRMGKSGGQGLQSPNHRSYDFATVSSQEIAKFYAEGFGLSLEKVVATGVPRTDIFFDKAYKKKVVRQFYKKYPQLKDKKILLFAPTFRGNGKNTGYYPVELFDVNKLYEQLGGEYAIIVKHHPFVKNRNPIQEEYQDYIIDLSKNSELNDLLFVTDALITDYSSVVFEASLLDIPMLFYVFDLEQYIATRGFYYEYETFVPGKIVYHFDEIASAVKQNDFEQEKIEPFKERFFDGKDGKSAERTVELIYDNLKK